MITKESDGTWLVEPEFEGSREYARLFVFATCDGLNIDGQGIIPWAELMGHEKI